ncbi:MAG: hypothetical protein ACLFS5_13655 [Spirochaetaceae bacterium]
MPASLLPSRYQRVVLVLVVGFVGMLHESPGRAHGLRYLLYGIMSKI